MKRKVKFGAGRIIGLAAIGLFLVAVIGCNIVCGIFSGSITKQLCGLGVNFEGERVEAVLELGDELCRELTADSVVMLENDGALPLENDERKVNLFGWASADNCFMLSGVGSAAATISGEKAVWLTEAFRDAGFAINEELIREYTAFQPKRLDAQDRSDDKATCLVEPDRSFYDKSGEGGNTLLENAKEFSDVAVVTFTRYGGEQMEIPSFQNKFGKDRDTTRTYLEISTEEEALLSMVCKEFDKVVLLLNTCNPMQLDFVDDYNINAVLYVGNPGQSGTRAIVDVLTGAVNPSGKTTDTYAVDHTVDPSYANRRKSGDDITYVEGIYVGYKWYETAFADKLELTVGDKRLDFSTEEGYRDIVVYPFGYGLTYSDFEWTVDDIGFYSREGDRFDIASGGTLESKYTTVKVDVAVTNVSDTPGKDVVELYYTPPYTKGGIEKSAMNLVAFEKTEVLDAGETQVVTLTFDIYDMASYDCYDDNANYFSGYELDPGEYTLRLMTDAHTPADCENATATFFVENTGTEAEPVGYKYRQDPTTKQLVRNRFTGEGAYAGCPVDGSFANPTAYFSRGDFAGTFPTSVAPGRYCATVEAAKEYIYTGYDGNAEPEQSDGGSGPLLITVTEEGGAPSKEQLETNTDIEYNEELLIELGSDYKNPKWDELLDQMTESEIRTLVGCGGFGLVPTVSIGKNKLFTIDGPSGLHAGVMVQDESKMKWTGYPSSNLCGSSWNKFLMYSYGRGTAAEALETGVEGIYAPAVNLHRSPYNGRYYEYYSEDPVLSGYLAAEYIAGAKTNGMTCYIKHFVCSEMGINPVRVRVWLTEQALRESYLRPFEIAVKKGGANAIMTGFNCLGAIWAGAVKALNYDILRTEWGFRGANLTDFATPVMSYMDMERGIRGGTDLWLNSDSAVVTIDLSKPGTLWCARRAVKNYLYSFANTMMTSFTYDGLPDKYSTEIGVRSTNKVFAWWIPALAGIDALIFLASCAAVFFILRGAGVIPSKKKAADGDDVGGPPPAGGAPARAAGTLVAPPAAASGCPPAPPDGGSDSSDALDMFAAPAAETDAAAVTGIPAISAGATDNAGFDERYAALPEDVKAYAEEVRAYALAVPGATERRSRSGLTVMLRGRALMKMRLRRGAPVALFSPEDDELRRLRKEIGLSARDTAVRLLDEKSVAAARRLIDMTASRRGV